jgi:IS30 family transposase
MPDEKEDTRLKRNRRRSREDLEKGKRREALAKIARSQSKQNSAKQQLDQRIGKLLEQGYSKASVAKRLGVTPRRIDVAIDAARTI